MTESESLNLDSFHKLLFSAFKDQTPKTKLRLLEIELITAYQLKVQAMGTLVQRLNDNLPFYDDLSTINNIHKSCCKLQSDIDTLIAEHPELMGCGTKTDEADKE